MQYRESDLDFSTRLMERFGISYHFSHAQSSHALVLTDDVGTHPMIAGGSREFKGVDGHHHADEEHFWEWYPERNMTTGAMRLTDYNFKEPMAMMEVDRTGDAAFQQGKIESYDYPGDYLARGQGAGEGKGVVGLRTRQERGHDRRHRAVGDCTSLGAGMTVRLTGDQVPGVVDAPYLCLSATHSYVSDAYGSGGEDSDGYAYTGSYVLMPAFEAPLAPERKTPVPAVLGPQTAVVVGEGEIDCDEYGRILVHFHWDLEKAFSMRCRVSQNWASQGWGGMVIPRIGMEVIVEFLEGDPDKPVVTGCVYNGKTKVPYELPKHKTRSTFKTDSHKAPYNGFNEIRFEDEKFQEELYVRAQKDMSIKVRNDRMKIIDRNETVFVGRDQIEKVRGSKHALVHGGYSIVVSAGNAADTLSNKVFSQNDDLTGLYGKISKSLSNVGYGGLSLFVESMRTAWIGGADTISVAGAKTTSVGGSYSIITGASFQVSSETKHSINARTIDLSATESLHLNVGECRFSMEKNGTITIKGKQVNIVTETETNLESGGETKIETVGNVTVIGSKIDLN